MEADLKLSDNADLPIPVQMSRGVLMVYTHFQNAFFAISHTSLAYMFINYSQNPTNTDKQS